MRYPDRHAGINLPGRGIARQFTGNRCETKEF
jgi:hypothetical protein